MNTTTTKTVAKSCSSDILESYEAYGCRINDLTPEELFAQYQRVGFLYPAKLERLGPSWDEVLQNWRRGLRGGELIHYVATAGNPATNAWASITSWRSTHTGWLTQHLVSIGNPLASRAVMLAVQAVRIRDGFDHAHQNWFRPSNRYANRIFGSIVQTLGHGAAAVNMFQYLAMPLPTTSPLNVIHIAPCLSSEGTGLTQLAESVRGRVYVIADELSHSDLLLEAVDDLYRRVGLRRYRRVWLANIPGMENPAGAVIAYRGPLGFNFSMLENRCDLLVSPDIRSELAADVCISLLRAAAPLYENFPPRTLLVTTDARSAELLMSCGGELIRPYAQSIWLREGYVDWYRHVEKFYKRVVRAEARRSTGQRSTGGGSDLEPK